MVGLTRRIGWGALAIGLGVLPARAQWEPQTPAPVRKVDIGLACAPAIERLCPALANAAPQPRNAAICLKPYRTSLTLPCRSAVSALLH